MNTLDSLELADNTVVLFASDNGSQFELTAPGMDLENAQNSPGSKVDSKSSGEVHRPNGKLRGTKWTAWEGGVRTPFVARWPNLFPAGAVSENLFALTDVLASLAAIVDYKLPEHSAQDSHNLLPLLQGRNKEIRTSLVVKASNDTYGLRWKNWKYIEGKEDQVPQLYDLSTDESETTNIHSKHPKIAQEMKQKLAEILNSNRTVTSR